MIENDEDSEEYDDHDDSEYDSDYADRGGDRAASKSRARYDASDDYLSDEAPVSEEAEARPIVRGSSRRDRAGHARKKAESAPVEAPAAAAREQQYAPTIETDLAEPEAAPPVTATAEWSLQTTDAAALYTLSQECASNAAVDCRFVSPYSGPVSLNAQQNYQVVEATLLRSDYGTFQGRLQALGNLLVRTEDVALAAPNDRVAVKVVVEYLP